MNNEEDAHSAFVKPWIPAPFALRRGANFAIGAITEKAEPTQAPAFSLTRKASPSIKLS